MASLDVWVARGLMVDDQIKAGAVLDVAWLVVVVATGSVITLIPVPA